MEQVIFGGYYDLLNTTTTEYNLLCGGYEWHATEDQRKQVVSTSGKIKNLRVKLDDSPGAGKKYVFTLMVNGAPSALTLEIADAATSGADTTHEVDVVAGDLISLQCDPDGTPSARRATWTSMFEGATSKESLILGTVNWLEKATIEYGLLAGFTEQSFTENDHRCICPTSGKIKNLYVWLDRDPGTSPDAYEFTLRQDTGAGLGDTALTVTITANDTTGNNTVDEITLSAGDVLTMKIKPLNAPSEEAYAAWGMTFLADTDGESVVMAGLYNDLNTGATEYIYLQSPDAAGWFGTESTRLQLGQSCTLKKLYLLLSAAPGDGKSYTFTLRKPGNGQADGNLTVTITGAATTTGSDLVNTDAISDDDYVDLKCVPANTPDVADAYWGLVGYIEPAAVGLENKSANMAAKMIAGKLI
ncbi:hypothetical protein ES703_105920 [subsurface metagenome]